MARIARTNKSWVLIASAHALSNVTPFLSQALTLDDENQFGVGGRAIRLTGSINIVVNNAAVIPAVTTSHIHIGCAVVDQNLATSMNLGTGEFADRRWLAREAIGGYPSGTGISGVVNGYAWTHRIDWRLRGGRGVLIRKDDALTLSSAISGTIVGQNASLHYNLYLLFETPS